MALDLETRGQLIETVRRFVNEVCRPNEQLVAETNAIPAHIVQEMRDLGLFGLSIAEWAFAWFLLITLVAAWLAIFRRRPVPALA